VRLAFLADASLPHTQRWVQFFVQRQHDCLLLSLEPADDPPCPFVQLPPRTWLPRFLRYTSNIAAAGRALRRFRPDVVNAHFLPNYGWMASRLGLRPLVSTTLGSDVLLVPRKSPLHRWRTKYVLRKSDHVTADAQMLSRAIERFGTPARRILVVPFGIETERFATPAPRPESPWVVLSTRRLEPVYDLGTLLRAVSLLQPEHKKELEVRLAGRGSQEEVLRGLPVEPRAHFLGWLPQEELDRELQRAHVYVSTARSDSTSVSLLEALAAGCFPVVTDIAGNREWIRHEKNGLLFPCGHAEALAACLERARVDVELRQRALGANRRLVSERGSWQRGMETVEELFRALAVGG
jgi:glycosyltransferase involved in cell wall biosynthesis